MLHTASNPAHWPGSQQEGQEKDKANEVSPPGIKGNTITFSNQDKLHFKISKFMSQIMTIEFFFFKTSFI